MKCNQTAVLGIFVNFHFEILAKCFHYEILVLLTIWKGFGIIVKYLQNVLKCKQTADHIQNVLKCKQSFLHGEIEKRFEKQ